MSTTPGHTEFGGQVWAIDWFVRELIPKLVKLPPTASLTRLERMIFDVVSKNSKELSAGQITQSEYNGRQVILGVISGYLELVDRRRTPT